MDENYQDQAEQQQTWWQKNKRLLIIVAVSILVLLLIFVLAIHWFGSNWIGFSGGESKVTKTPQGTNTEYSPGKTLWDWMQLLFVPAVLAFGGLWFTRTQQLRDREHEKLQHERDQQLADQRAKNERETAEKRAQTERDIVADNQRETALQTYFDRMSELLLHEKLRDSPPEAEVRKIARIRTLRVLPGLDGARKKSVLQFLHESDLIRKPEPAVHISSADIGQADLKWIHLENDHLNGVRGKKADLRWAYLYGAELRGIYLAEADLREADLREADLFRADLSGANLSGANLSNANLSEANLCETEYNTKVIQEKDAQGKLVTIGPTQWPQGFDLRGKEAICVDC